MIALASSLRPAPVWFVALGTKPFFSSHGVANVVEMDWSESATINFADSNLAAAKADLTGFAVAGASGRGDSTLYQQKTEDLVVTCVPVQHWCQRSVNDKNKALWASVAPRGSLHGGGSQIFFYTDMRSILMVLLAFKGRVDRSYQQGLLLLWW